MLIIYVVYNIGLERKKKERRMEGGRWRERGGGEGGKGKKGEKEKERKIQFILVCMYINVLISQEWVNMEDIFIFCMGFFNKLVFVWVFCDFVIEKVLVLVWKFDI